MQGSLQGVSLRIVLNPVQSVRGRPDPYPYPIPPHRPACAVTPPHTHRRRGAAAHRTVLHARARTLPPALCCHRATFTDMWKPLSESWPYGPAIAATAADILGQAIVTPALPFYLDQIGLPEADLPRWSGLIMGTQFAAVVLGSLISGRVGDTYGSAAAVRLALRGQVFFFALSAFAPFGVVGDPKLAVILLLLTRIGAGVSTALVSALLYIFDRAPSSQVLL